MSFILPDNHSNSPEKVFCTILGKIIVGRKYRKYGIFGILKNSYIFNNCVIDNCVVELYTVLVSQIGEFYFMYNTQTRLYFFLDTCICVFSASLVLEMRFVKQYIIQLHDYLTYIIPPRSSVGCRGYYTV